MSSAALSSSSVEQLAVNFELIANFTNMSTTTSSSSSSIINNSELDHCASELAEDLMDHQDWMKILIHIVSAAIMIFIIMAAIFGNLLVIISVMRVRKLR